ncbi:MAG: hypothetical protein WC729_21015 [Sphingomonas sp.]|jgi:hypothetical protein|uniref:hypothetical protein n=1 Tax=Sphingomonas sp. TaxID=28214 RepID=UPI00356B43DE
MPASDDSVTTGPASARSALFRIVGIYGAYFAPVTAKTATVNGAFFRCYSITGKSVFKPLFAQEKSGRKIQLNSGKKRRKKETELNSGKVGSACRLGA